VTPQPDLNACHRDDRSSTHAELVDEPVQDGGAHALNSESGGLILEEHLGCAVKNDEAALVVGQVLWCA